MLHGAGEYVNPAISNNENKTKVTTTNLKLRQNADQVIESLFHEQQPSLEKLEDYRKNHKTKMSNEARDTSIRIGGGMHEVLEGDKYDTEAKSRFPGHEAVLNFKYRENAKKIRSSHY